VYVLVHYMLSAVQLNLLHFVLFVKTVILKFQIPIAEYLSIKFFVDDCAKLYMLCFVDHTKSTLTNCLQVRQFTVGC